MWSHWALPVYKQPPSHEKMWNILCTTLKNAYRSYLTWMTWVPPEEPSFSYGMIDDTWMNISVEEIKANTCTKMCAMSLSLQKSQKQP